MAEHFDEVVHVRLRALEASLEDGAVAVQHDEQRRGFAAGLDRLSDDLDRFREQLGADIQRVERRLDTRDS